MIDLYSPRGEGDGYLLAGVGVGNGVEVVVFPELDMVIESDGRTLECCVFIAQCREALQRRFVDRLEKLCARIGV
jgi:hypothetical protein